MMRDSEEDPMQAMVAFPTMVKFPILGLMEPFNAYLPGKETTSQ